MDTFVIAGGNGGIGLQAARDLHHAGHRVILLGRDQKKGDQAIASFETAKERVVFLAVDLSTIGGVREAAQKIDEITDRVDGILHSAAVFETGDVRTKDGFPLFYALSFLSRYHLTQLLLPKLLKSEHPRVMMFIATLKEIPKVDPSLFPDFKKFNFIIAVTNINGACMLYADHLVKTYPQMFAGCATPGFVLTDIFKNAPWYIKLYVKLTAFKANSAQTAAHNVVQALLRAAPGQALNWTKPGDFDHPLPIKANPDIRQKIMESSRQVTGV